MFLNCEHYDLAICIVHESKIGEHFDIQISSTSSSSPDEYSKRAPWNIHKHMHTATVTGCREHGLCKILWLELS